LEKDELSMGVAFVIDLSTLAERKKDWGVHESGKVGFVPETTHGAR
jgi:hypothetical protein